MGRDARLPLDRKTAAGLGLRKTDLALSRRRYNDVSSSIKLMPRSEEHTSELPSPCNLVCRLLLEKPKKTRRLSPPANVKTSSASLRVILQPFRVHTYRSYSPRLRNVEQFLLIQSTSPKRPGLRRR